MALGQKKYSSRLRFKAGPTLNRCRAVSRAAHILSVSLLGCCLTLWSFLVQIGRVSSINRTDEAFRMSGQRVGVKMARHVLGIFVRVTGHPSHLG